jgi:hypothetical protein
MKPHQSQILLSLIVLTTFSFHVSYAEARGRIRSLGSALSRGAHHTGPVMTRDQLRTCVTQKNSLNIDGEKLDAGDNILKHKSEEIENQEAIIREQEPLVDERSQQSVDAFNSLVRAHKERIAAYNGSIAEYNAKVDIYRNDVNLFNSRCAGQPYYKSDMQAILDGK